MVSGSNDSNERRADTNMKTIDPACSQISVMLPLYGVVV